VRHTFRRDEQESITDPGSWLHRPVNRRHATMVQLHSPVLALAGGRVGPSVGLGDQACRRRSGDVARRFQRELRGGRIASEPIQTPGAICKIRTQNRRLCANRGFLKSFKGVFCKSSGPGRPAGRRFSTAGDLPRDLPYTHRLLTQLRSAACGLGFPCWRLSPSASRSHPRHHAATRRSGGTCVRLLRFSSFESCGCPHLAIDCDCEAFYWSCSGWQLATAARRSPRAQAQSRGF